MWERKYKCVSAGRPAEEAEKEWHNDGTHSHKRWQPKECMWRPTQCRHVQMCSRFNIDDKHTRYSFNPHLVKDSPFTIIDREKTESFPKHKVSGEYETFYENSDVLKSYDKVVAQHSGRCSKKFAQSRHHRDNGLLQTKG